MIEAIQKRLEHNQKVSLGRKKIEPLLGRELREAQVKAGARSSRLLVRLSCDIAELVWTRATTQGLEGMTMLGAKAIESARAWANGESNIKELERANDDVRKGFGTDSTLVAVMVVPVKVARYFDPEWLLTRDETERPMFLGDGVASVCELLCPNAATALHKLRGTDWDTEQGTVFEFLQRKLAV